MSWLRAFNFFLHWFSIALNIGTTSCYLKYTQTALSLARQLWSAPPIDLIRCGYILSTFWSTGSVGSVDADMAWKHSRVSSCVFSTNLLVCPLPWFLLCRPQYLSVLIIPASTLWLPGGFLVHFSYLWHTSAYSCAHAQPAPQGGYMPCLSKHDPSYQCMPRRIHLSTKG